VDGPVTKLELDKEGMELIAGDTGELSIFALEADVEQTSTPVWSSNNTDVATVDQEGKVTAVAEGEATITVTVDNASASATVVVLEPLPAETGSYAAGYLNTGGKNIATVWHNGEVLYQLSEEISRANSIFVDDKVYVAGTDLDPNTFKTVASLWVNGQVVELEGGADFGVANSVYVENGATYVAGKIGNEPALWENGNLVPLDIPQTQESYISGTSKNVFVSNGDIYVAGTFNYDGFSRAILWKNGEIDFFSSENSGANSLFVDGDTAYVVGYVDAGSGKKAVTWVDGELNAAFDLVANENILNGFEEVGLSVANSVYVRDGNVYVVGYMDAAIQDDFQTYGFFCENQIIVENPESFPSSIFTSIQVNTSGIDLIGGYNTSNTAFAGSLSNPNLTFEIVEPSRIYSVFLKE